jgi:hypothetical protein
VLAPGLVFAPELVLLPAMNPARTPKREMNTLATYWALSGFHTTAPRNAIVIKINTAIKARITLLILFSAIARS